MVCPYQSQCVERIFRLFNGLLLKNIVYILFKVELEFFEQILKEQADQLTGEFKSLVAIVVFVVKLGGIKARLDNSADHQSHVTALCKVRHVLAHRNVGQDNVLKNIFYLCNPCPGFARISRLLRLQPLSNVVKSLGFTENISLTALLQR